MGHLVISMIMTTVMHTVDGCLYVQCVCMCVHVCLKKDQNAPRPSEHLPASFLKKVVSTFKSVCVYTGTGVLRLSSTILEAGDDLLSIAAGKPRYVQLKRLR